MAQGVGVDIGLLTESALRLAFFFGVFATCGVFEWWAPRRKQERWQRWISNIGVSALNQLTVRLIVPITGVQLASLVEEAGWGLLNWASLPMVPSMLVAVLLLDLVIYVQHRVYHLVPLLWRFHRMHHADTQLDVTTGVRFHPVSILLSALIKLGAICIIGPSALAVLIFEVLLNATSLFNHSNIKIPAILDRTLRLVVVTPDMHRVHHSILNEEMNRNFGFNFPWWDRLLGSYHAQPGMGHEDMQLGLEQFRDAEEIRLIRMLSQPFR